MTNSVVIYTDGACSGNPGPGGWGALLRTGTHERELRGGEAQSTNNRMEMMAVIAALEALSWPCVVALYTDSRYVMDGVTKWMVNWKRNGWRTAKKKPVKNVDLWQRLELAIEPHDVSWNWVKGHNGDPDNERVDALARLAIKELRD